MTHGHGIPPLVTLQFHHLGSTAQWNLAADIKPTRRTQGDSTAVGFFPLIANPRFRKAQSHFLQFIRIGILCFRIHQIRRVCCGGGPRVLFITACKECRYCGSCRRNELRKTPEHCTSWTRKWELPELPEQESPAQELCGREQLLPAYGFQKWLCETSEKRHTFV